MSNNYFKVIRAGINTTFEQYKDLYANLGLSASYDDLKTLGNDHPQTKDHIEDKEMCQEAKANN